MAGEREEYMATGNKIVAVIGKVDGKEPEIQIADQDFKVMTTRDGTICIVYCRTEKFYASDREL